MEIDVPSSFDLCHYKLVEKFWSREEQIYHHFCLTWDIEIRLTCGGVEWQPMMSVWVVFLCSILPFQSSGKDVYQKPPNDPIGSSSSSDQVVGILQAVTFILRKHCKRKTSNMIRIWFLDPFFPVHKSLEQWDPAVLVPTRRWNLKARMSPTLYVSLFFIHVCTYPIFHRFYQLVFAFYRLCTCVWRHFLLYTTSYVWI